MFANIDYLDLKRPAQPQILLILRQAIYIYVSAVFSRFEAVGCQGEV